MRQSAFAILICVAVLVTAAPASAAGFLVYNTADSGPGSLRQAIWDANGHAGADVINFIFSSSTVTTIQVITALPQVTDTLTIDGTTPMSQIAGRPLVEIKNVLVGSGHGFTTGFDLQAPNCVVKNLIINSFYVAINIGPPGGSTIQGNWIGLSGDGVTAAPNSRGIQTEAGSSSNQIGGTTAAQRNVISGSDNEGIGIVIGGLCQLPHCGSDSSSNDVIEGNFIGTDVTGTVAVPNIQDGIWLTSTAVNTRIGGTSQTGDTSRNLISGNPVGVSVDGSAYIQYNWIGLNANGAPLGNTYYGVWTFDESGSVIAFNKIAYNGSNGIQVSGHHTFIYSNSIFSNGGLGISLGSSGPTPNDPGDTDSGANDLQNYPVINTAVSEATQLKVTGTLNSTPNSNYYVSFYSSASCDPSGNGEGETFVFATGINTDANGNASFSLTTAVTVAAGRYLTATARDASLNSSEFSQCRQVVAAGPPIVTSMVPTTGPWGATVTLTGSHFTTVSSVGFNYGTTNASFQVLSDTQMITTVPTGALSGPIQVVNPYGSTLTDTFTVNNPAPSLKTISPNTGLGAGGTNVTIRGARFLAGATVRIGNVPATNVVVVNSSTITATTGAHLAGTVDVTVTNVDGKTGSLPASYTYYCSPELFTAITAPATVPPASTSNASVQDSGPGVNYSWGISGGSIASGSGTPAITFTVGTTDVVLTVTVTSSACGATSSRTVVVAVTRDDFNRDAKSDIALQNGLNGDVAIWIMNGTAMTTGVLAGTAGQYRARTVGDFNGDGHNDIVLQDPSGAIVMWLMNGTTISSGLGVANPGVDWQIVGSGDVNGDRKADLVLRNTMSGDVAIWTMNGPGITNAAIVGTPGTAFNVVGIADFDHDRKSDILLQNSSGDIAGWLLNGFTITSALQIGNPGAGWLVKGAGDVNGDGAADILLRNSNTGDIAVWQMNGLQLVSGFNMGGPGTAYDLMGSADFDGDGMADLLLRDNSGTLAAWLLNGPAIKAGGVVGSTGVDYVPVMK